MSEFENFFQSKTARIYYDKHLDTLFLEYLGKVKNHAEFVEINSALLSAFKTLHTQKFVADVRFMGVIAVESQQWVVENLLPGMFDHLKGKPLYHAQLLDPAEVFSKISAANIRSKSTQIADGFQVEQFTDRADLENRLKNLPK